MQQIAIIKNEEIHPDLIRDFFTSKVKNLLGIGGEILIRDYDKEYSISDRFINNISNAGLNKLGLINYQCISSDDMNSTKIAEFAKILNEIAKEYDISTISNYSKFLCWIHPFAKPYSSISSTTFYELPFISFITNAAFRTIAPAVVFPANYGYALFENLYHESLHQQLIITLCCSTEGLFKRPPGSNYSIHIPWRNINWTLEHSLQAAYVYIHLLFTRIKQYKLEKEQHYKQLLNEAINQAKYALNILINGLIQHKSAFNEEDLAIIYKMNEFYLPTIEG